MGTAGAVVGWGTALPPTVVTNADLEARLDTSDEWIVERSGIRERRVGGTVGTLAVDAARAALARAGIGAAEVDLLVLATTTPDETVPATSAAVHHALGLRCGAFDLNAACSGFVYGLAVANGAVATGARRVLVVGADCLSGITDPDDRGTAVLFADGAGAVVLEAAEHDDVLLAFDLGIDGSGHDILTCAHGGTIHMEGREVFRRAVRVTVDSATEALERAKLSPADVDLFVPHQANLRIIEAAAARLGIPMEKAAIVLDRTGNTSSASIPLALAEAADAGRLAPGDIVLLSGFGAGMSWASAVLRWAGPRTP
ncbi:MAG TPA: beta-ketoacyl-ACP synthase III [Acidimicrobiales bacterium]|nr:beta-ketoacyl-ACP synthase III [Acidimicrobiales bacterium]